MKRVRILSIAREDAGLAAQYYEAEKPGLGKEFLDELKAKIQMIRRFPTSGKPTGSRVRTTFLRRFPFYIVYQVGANELSVISIAHQSREPEFWIARLHESGSDNFS
jgi:plasmid stabilization system protein ParE